MISQQEWGCLLKTDMSLDAVLIYMPTGGLKNPAISQRVLFSRSLGFLVWWASLVGLRWSRICLWCGRTGFDPWVGKVPWKKEWQPTPVFLPGDPHGQRSLAGYSPGLGRSPGKRSGNPLQYSCLENPMDRAVWQATVHVVAKSRTREGLTLYSSEHIKCLQRFLVPPSCNPLWKCQPWNKRSFALPTPFLFHDQLEGGHPALCVPILIILHHFRDSSALVNLLKILTLLEDW